ncbi:hypothetical protein ONA22_01280 [Mycoplasmopsis cynos]|nr:hypothetical protein [Mycoplasmopsis cynos]WAM03667.1 hypothetical protein ONA22_01280 [Mycoplasmopsis cynos]
MVEDKLVYVAKGAFVENTFSAYVLANVGPFDEVKKAAEEKVIK